MKNKKMKILQPFILWFSLLAGLNFVSVASSQASLVTLDFEAKVVSTSSPSISAIYPVNTTFSGSFSYESDENNLTLGVDSFALRTFRDSRFALSLTAGPLIADPVNPGPAATYTVVNFNTSSNMPPHDSFKAVKVFPFSGLFVGKNEFHSFEIFLEDNTGAFFSDQARMPAELPLSAFDEKTITLKFLPPFGDPNSIPPPFIPPPSIVVANLTSLSVQPVPEPKTVWLLAAGLLCIFTARGIMHSNSATSSARPKKNSLAVLS